MNMKKFTSCLLSILVITTSLLAAGCAGGEDNKRLVIFEAGSLLVNILILMLSRKGMAVYRLYAM